LSPFDDGTSVQIRTTALLCGNFVESAFDYG
jgi:hypothetical protein